MPEYIDKKTVLDILNNGGYLKQQLEEIEALPVVETDQKPEKKSIPKKKKAAGECCSCHLCFAGSPVQRDNRDSPNGSRTFYDLSSYKRPGRPGYIPDGCIVPHCSGCRSYRERIQAL